MVISKYANKYARTLGRGFLLSFNVSTIFPSSCKNRTPNFSWIHGFPDKYYMSQLPSPLQLALGMSLRSDGWDVNTHDFQVMHLKVRSVAFFSSFSPYHCVGCKYDDRSWSSHLRLWVESCVLRMIEQKIEVAYTSDTIKPPLDCLYSNTWEGDFPTIFFFF